MSYITIDDYYDVEFYNEALEALKNNNIEFKEFISIKSPFNWVIKLPDGVTPIMINYDILPSSQERFIINKIQALKPNEEYLLLRKNDSKGQTAIIKYTENDALLEARKSNYSVFFNVRNKEQLEKITKDSPLKIYYMGKYYNKYKVAMCNNKMILNYIDRSDILLENNGEYDSPGRFESELNYKIFRNKDMLEKYTFTPYFENGKYYIGNVKGDRKVAKRFII